MTYTYLILLFLALQFAIKMQGQSLKQDTVFLLKDANHVIFIDENKNSKFYNEISSFEFNEFEKEQYETSLNFLNNKNV